MPRLLVFTARKLITILKKKGFKLDHTTGGHFIFYHAETKRRVTVPYHSKDIPKGTFLSILRQAGFSMDDFR